MNKIEAIPMIETVNWILPGSKTKGKEVDEVAREGR